MIGLRLIGGDDHQFVASLDGIDMTVWEETGDAVPDDLESRPYAVVDGTLAPLPPTLTLFEFMNLWTPIETVAVMQSTTPLMAYAWARTLASPIIALSDSRVIAGVQLARQLGILTADRAARILAGLAPE